MRTRSHSPRSERSRLVPDRVRHAEPPEAVDEAGAAQRAHLVRRRARAGAPASAASSATAREWPERVGRLEVDEVGDRQQRRVELAADEPHAEGRLGVDHGVPRPRSSRPSKISSASRAEQRGQRRVELGPAALAGERPAPRRPRRPGGPPRCTRRAGRHAPPCGICVARQRRRANPCRPIARRTRRRASRTASASPSCAASDCAIVGVLRDHVVHVAVAARRRTRARLGTGAAAGCRPRASRSIATAPRRLRRS